MPVQTAKTAWGRYTPKARGVIAVRPVARPAVMAKRRSERVINMGLKALGRETLGQRLGLEVLAAATWTSA